MIIGISGYIQSGKSTAANLMKRYLANKYKEQWEIKSFAGKVKQVASILTGAPVEKFEDANFKNTLMSKDWGVMTYRMLLQKIGTELFRDLLNKDTWVIALMQEYIPEDSWLNTELTKEPEVVFPKWIVSDVRYPNEAKAIKDRGGIIIRVERSSIDRNLHESEIALDGYKFDFVVNNEGSLSEFQTEVFNFIDYVKAIKRIL